MDVEKLIDQFVRQPEVGLAFDPFRELDAGRDPHLPDYLVDQGAFEKLWTRQHTLLFAEPGAGKSAHRVRLARACRIGLDGRKIFPIVFRVPDPTDVGFPPEPLRFLSSLLQVAAGELLLELAYQPRAFLAQPAEFRRAIRGMLEHNLGFDLAFLLSQLAETGDLEPLVELFDPTATRLPALPSPASLRNFCDTLMGTLSTDQAGFSADQRWQSFVTLLLDTLAYEAIFVLLDGVDAYPLTLDDPGVGISLISPLVEHEELWANRPVFVKGFLPSSYQSELEKRSPVLLTAQINFAIISWNADSLVEVLQQRLRAASQGAFSSFNAFSTPGLRDAEDEIVHHLKRPLPREAVRVAERLLAEHVLRVGVQGRLEAEDLDRALDWYQKDVGAK